MSTHSFFARQPFAPDPFQIEAAEAVERGESVIVTAPTGAGKTLIAEAAIELALATGRRAFYTTPLKALSNQKYGDFVGLHGADRVGLLTGDNSINGRAPVVVMTTEVLRNMIYAASADLDDVGIVVLDEVHYLQDPFRGAVWEEVIIHAPRSMQLVALSATVSNAGEFTDWVRERRGRTRLVIEDHRPVPLESLWAVRDLHTSDPGLVVEPLLVDAPAGARGAAGRPGGAPEQVVNPGIVRLMRRARGRRRRFATPRRLEVVETLLDRDMLPAIYFIFSRAGCEDAAAAMLNAGVRLTDREAREEIRDRAFARTAHLDPADLEVLAFDRWLAQLEAGVAAHHAGMVPAFKEAVEELFAAGLVRLVFATETLSLGINMPARTVVLDKLTKYTGEGHELLLPGEYTQLTGRAGRRGIDVKGFGVVLHSPYLAAQRMAEIARAGSHALRSSFRPTYNMAANLVANYDRAEAERLLRASFAQFQRDRAVRRLAKAIGRNEQRLATAREAATCERGDVMELVSAASGSAVARRGAAREAELLRVGEIVDLPSGRRAGRYVITGKRRRKSGASFDVLDARGERRQIRSREFPGGTEVLGRIAIPTPHPPVDPAQVRAIVEALTHVDDRSVRVLGGVPGRPDDTNPAATCPAIDQHLAAARRVRRLERELSRQRHQYEHQGEGLVGELRRVLELLEAQGYVTGWALTDLGDMLRFVYNELDLIVVEAVAAGVFDRLSPPELAALTSAFVYEPRIDDAPGGWPTPELEDQWDRLHGLWTDVAAVEQELGLPGTRVPEPGFGALAYHWSRGIELDELLGDDDMAAGDFVRTARQLLDLLRQLRDAVPALHETASAAIRLVDRGVVAAGGIG